MASSSADAGLLAAFGMILGVQNAHRITSPRLGAISNSTNFAWRLVVTPRYVGNRSALHLIVPCHDAPDAVSEKARDNLLYPGSFKQTSCACKTAYGRAVRRLCGRWRRADGHRERGGRRGRRRDGRHGAGGERRARRERHRLGGGLQNGRHGAASGVQQEGHRRRHADGRQRSGPDCGVGERRWEASSRLGRSAERLGGSTTLARSASERSAMGEARAARGHGTCAPVARGLAAGLARSREILLENWPFAGVVARAGLQQVGNLIESISPPPLREGVRPPEGFADIIQSDFQAKCRKLGRNS